MPEAFTPYQRRLFVFLSVATFFEGYDFIALTQILPNLRADLKLGVEWSGYLVAFINFGTVLAYPLIRSADRWGRRRVLAITIAGYTVFSVLSGLSPNVYVFAVAQLVARIFLIAEWAISAVVAAEEFPAARRGTVIGVISAFSALGSILCAGLGPVLLATAYGWRTVYFVGIVPLVLLGFARRNLQETRRFAEQAAARSARGSPEARPFLTIWRTAHRGRMLKLGVIWFFTYICTQNAVAFWKEFAVAERGFDDKKVGLAISIAAVGALGMAFFAGKLLDLVGRRRGALFIFGSGAVGIWCAYSLHGFWPLTLALVFAIFSASGVLVVLNTYNTELFPTDMRADAFAWSNNMIGRISYVFSPLFIGFAARTAGWEKAVRPTALMLLIAVALIFALLPETRARELEDTAAA
jgi:MFS transporter, putative metabolite:H+ symporter